MGKIKPYPPVKLIAAVTVSQLSLWQDLKPLLESRFSPIDTALDWFDFTFTDYYREEMGADLKKRMISFQKLIPAEELPAIKIFSNQLEERFKQAGRRRVNIDPGYICQAKLILATTKDFIHRIYLGSGIFGDLHLRLRHGKYEPLEWTYPDYQQPQVLAYFTKVRDVYLEQLGLDWNGEGVGKEE